MRNILVVEDSEAQRRAFARLLDSEPCALRFACDGDEAMQRMREQVPDLVLLDLLMPVCDGWVVRRRMLEDLTLRRVPVIIITGVDVPTAGWSALRVDGAIRKPFAKSELLSMIDRIFVDAA